jgi:hypothetical protein
MFANVAAAHGRRTAGVDVAATNPRTRALVQNRLMEERTMHRRTWLGAAGLVGVAAAAGVMVGQGAAPADASTTVTLSREQLVINQRISQAAVRRSNEALALLDPVRAVPSQPSKVLGWSAQHLADGAVTGPKLANGSVSAAKLAPGAAGAPTDARTLLLAGTVAVPVDRAVLAHLDLPAGSWVVFAKAYAATEGPLRTVSCTLSAGADTDETLAGVQKDAPASLGLQVAHTFAGTPGAVELGCSAPAEGGLGSGLNAIRLTAIQADVLTATTPRT